jgi:hypothetical protein
MYHIKLFDQPDQMIDVADQIGKSAPLSGPGI